MINHNTENNLTEGRGIKIRARQPQNRQSTGLINQGIAPRRIRLQLQSNSEVKEREEVNEGHTVIPEAKEAAAKYSEKSGSLVKPQIKLRVRGTIGQVKGERFADDEVQVQSRKRRGGKRWKVVATVMVAVMVGVGMGIWRTLVSS
jgi:hypothetical protein